MIFGHLGCVGAGTVCDSHPLRHSRDDCRSNLHQLILEHKYFYRSQKKSLFEQRTNSFEIFGSVGLLIERFQFLAVSGNVLVMVAVARRAEMRTGLKMKYFRTFEMRTGLKMKKYLK